MKYQPTNIYMNKYDVALVWNIIWKGGVQSKTIPHDFSSYYYFTLQKTIYLGIENKYVQGSANHYMVLYFLGL
jgi:hypothetical protein